MYTKVWWIDRLFYTALALAVVGSILLAFGWNEQGKMAKEHQRFSLLFGVQYPESEPGKKQFAPTILNRLNEIRKNLETRKERNGDDQLQVTFNELCQLAKTNGFSEEAESAKCSP